MSLITALLYPLSGVIGTTFVGNGLVLFPNQFCHLQNRQKSWKLLDLTGILILILYDLDKWRWKNELVD